MSKINPDDPKLIRFKEVLEILKARKITQKEVADKMGIHEQYLSSLGKVRNLTFKLVERFMNAFPEFNINYILDGKEPIELSDKIKMPYTINASEPPLNYGQSSATAQKPLEIFILDEQNLSLSLFTGTNSAKEEGFISFPGSEYFDLIVKVLGEAMYPDVHNGGKIFLKQIVDRDVIFYGHCYLIHTVDLILCRFIDPDNNNHNNVVLRAKNAKYSQVSIPRKKILNLFLVKKVMNDHA